MSRAILCDACGTPVNPLEAVELEVSLPGRCDDTAASWSEIGRRIDRLRAERRDLASFLRRRADRDDRGERIGEGAADGDDLRRAADLLDPDGPEGL